MSACIDITSCSPTDVATAAHAACARIAPNWPLDRLIAVNPWWHLTHLPFTEATAELRQLGGINTHARSFAAAALRDGSLLPRHVALAIDRTQSKCTPAEVLAHAEHPSSATPRFPLVVDHADAVRDIRNHMSWNDFVVHQVSQQCAAFFDTEQARWRPPAATRLYTHWQAFTASDRSPRLLMGLRGSRTRARQLPADPLQAIAFVTQWLQVPDGCQRDYFTALLLGVNGWAAWCAWLAWQAGLDGQPAPADQDPRLDLLAMRLAWEYLLADDETPAVMNAAWARHYASAAQDHDAAQAANVDDVLLTALEIAWQARVCDGLAAAQAAGAPPNAAAAITAQDHLRTPRVQAVFCIDVRSEPFRRALEGVAPWVETRGFAGFFGLPIDYTPLGADAPRPQLPGLLSPTLHVTDAAADAAVQSRVDAERRSGAQADARWRSFRTGAASAFTFVETLGLSYGWQLLRQSLPAVRVAGRPQPARATQALRPQLHGAALDVRTDVAAKVLAAMGLERDVADVVLLLGHGSSTANNPHAASLHCGACGGQTGEVNARACAALLNDPEVRAALAQRGVHMPAGTRFVAGLHDTTTDEVTLFDVETGADAADGAPHITALTAALASAGEHARAARAGALGIHGTAPGHAALLRTLKARGNDWAQVRPEWGLANNAAFIAAPRARTRHMDLEGRAFLHDYDHAGDPDGSTLELIMTAPMVVAHWINLQYYASTVDNLRYGSGNKVLHNVVGGHIGVFEGNGGDLRIGLPMQSLHDGTRWRHTPLRLSVFLEAPMAAIEAVLARHPAVDALVRNRWLHLFAITPGSAAIHRRAEDRWLPEGPALARITSRKAGE